jgi:PAP2 superfamily
VYAAVLAVDGRRRHASVLAAVSAAAHTVLTAEFPAQAARLDQELDAALAAVPDDPARADGVAAGNAAAYGVLAERAGDGRDGPQLSVPAPNPGVWTPAPPNLVGSSSWLGDVRPFVIDTGSQIRPGGPPALDSRRWTRDYNETRLLGSATSTERTAAQTEVARFWADPPLAQNQRGLRAYTQTQALDAVATARLFALADTASADALIACFHTKYHYEFWRPFSAIPAGDSDGNPDTPADPAWRPLLPTPNFPEYPSAHSCSTTAIASVVAALAPGHRLDLTLDSTTTGSSHHFTSVRKLTAEVANARVWGGLHWRFSTEDGSRIGRSVARAVLATTHDHQDQEEQ